jgi:hypothetical protein
MFPLPLPPPFAKSCQIQLHLSANVSITRENKIPLYSIHIRLSGERETDIGGVLTCPYLDLSPGRDSISSA